MYWALGFKSPGEAIGKILYPDIGGGNEKACPIVGVVADFHDANFHEAIGPVLIGIVLLTVGSQVIKAALANPVKNLRIE